MEPKFEKRYYQRKFSGIFGGKLFTWKELEFFLNLRPLMTDARVIQWKGKFSWGNSVWHRDPNCYPPSIIGPLFEEGVVAIVDASRFTFKLNDFAKKLEEEYNNPIDAHIYVCRNVDTKHPFGCHFDLSDNVIVQCEGKSNFKVWDRMRNLGFGHEDNVKSNDLTMKDDPIIDVDMRPGDAIWIPKFYPHLASSKTPRMSVSFPSYHKLDKSYEERDWIKL